MTFDNKGRFSLWKNEKRREGKNDAEFTGTFTDDNGVEYYVNGWKRRPDQSDKAPALSGTIRKKEEHRAPEPKEFAEHPLKNDPFADTGDDDDVGF